jgi:hypothetical protein
MAKTWAGTYSDMLVEIEKKIEAQFNPKKQTVEAPKIPAIQGVTTVRQSNNTTSINLTEAEKKAAHGIFPESKNPEKDYIKLREQQQKQGAIQ